MAGSSPAGRADSSVPLRIVSLVPSTTETVFALGCGERLVGVTRFCVHPPEARERAVVVGGTKSPRLERLFALEPDLVLANQEENRKEDVEQIRLRCPVHLAFPRTAKEAVSDILTLGGILGSEGCAKSLAAEIESARLALHHERERDGGRFRYLYFIWRRPFMVAGSGTFIDGFLAEAGGTNVAPAGRGRYPEITPEEIAAADADVFLLSSEPFPFRETHRSELAENGAGERDRVLLVDGELLSWHGARMRMGLPYLRELARRIDVLRGEPRSKGPGEELRR